MSVWRNDIKCKYMFMFPLKNLARKGLIEISIANIAAKYDNKSKIKSILTVSYLLTTGTAIHMPKQTYMKSYKSSTYNQLGCTV